MMPSIGPKPPDALFDAKVEVWNDAQRNGNTFSTASRRVDEKTTTLAADSGDAERLPPGKAMGNGSLLTYWIPRIQPFEEFASLKPGETRCVERGDSEQTYAVS
jgi:hypothetical protein